jgi:hypothetical protein
MNSKPATLNCHFLVKVQLFLGFVQGAPPQKKGRSSSDSAFPVDHLKRGYEIVPCPANITGPSLVAKSKFFLYHLVD